MAGSLPTTMDECLSELRRAAEGAWGAERAAAIERNLENVARALAAVAAFPLPAEVEPLPTWPEAPHA